MLTLPEIVGPTGLLTDGDWVESKDQDPCGAIRLTQLADVGDGAFRHRSDRWINEEQAVRLNVTLLEPGDVLVARMPDPLGRACVCPPLPTPAVTVVDVCIVRAPLQNPKWLMHVINAPQTRARIASFQSGSTRKRISKANLSTIPIPLPERSEQDRIVAVIETHFSRLDAAVASLQRANANVKRARASVLQAAVEGQLVPTEAAIARAEGRDYEPASALLARILADRKRAWVANGARGKYREPVAPTTEELSELPEGWCWATLEQLGEASRPFAYGVLVPGSDIADGVPFVRVGDIAEGTVADRPEKRIARKVADEFKRTYLQGGEVLLSIVGTIGRVGIASPRLRGANVARAVGVLPLTSDIESSYVVVAMRSPATRRRLVSAAHEVARKTLNLEDVRATEVPLPPLPEQHRIVAEVNCRLSVLDALDATLDANLARCARLRQAILQRAFTSQLVPAEPLGATQPVPV